MASTDRTIDDLSQPQLRASNGAAWEFVSDGVMGGVSTGTLCSDVIEARNAIRLRGDVSLRNNGGFLQMALNLDADGGPVDASRWAGIALDVFGNGEIYNLHLRTTDMSRPWQSYRTQFGAEPVWRTLRLPFEDFERHRIDMPLDPARLRRIGIVAIGRAFEADVAIGGMCFFAN